MKNHFIFPWNGNKRMEVENIVEKINLSDDITTVIEPYCGSSAFSVYLSKLYPKKYKYIINDIDENLIKLYNYIKNDDQKIQDLINDVMKSIKNKDDYLKIISKSYENKFISWFISNKIYNVRPGLYNLNYKYNDEKKLKFKDYEIFKFLIDEDVEILNIDGIDLIKKYFESEKNLIFIDPPYLDSCNDFYSDKRNTNIYEYISNNNLIKKKSFILLVLEETWIIKLLFKNYFSVRYSKVYQFSKKKTFHILITNNKKYLKEETKEDIKKLPFLQIK
jgi:site-specific DNA-adenine methylase